MDKNSVLNAVELEAAGNWPPHQMQYNEGLHWLKIKILEPFENKTSYIVKINSNAAKDLAGNRLADDVSIKFQTE